MLVAGAGAAFVWWLAAGMPGVLFEMRLNDAWFGADVPARYDALTNRLSEHGGGYKHPLFGLLHLPVCVVATLVRDPHQAVAVLLALNGGAWASLVFVICYRLTGRCLDAAIYTALGLSSACGVFWLPVAETYGFASTSVLIPLLVVTLPSLSRSTLAHVAGIVFGAGVTITNSAIGALAAFFSTNRRQCAVIAAGSLALFGALSLAHSAVFPNTPRLLDAKALSSDLAAFVQPKSLPRLLRSFFLDPIVPPTLHFAVFTRHQVELTRKDGTRFRWPPRDLQAVRVDPPPVPHRLEGRRAAAAISAAHAAWILLVAGGAVALVRRWHSHPAFPVVAFGLAAQGVLHLLYGQSSEEFLHVAHWFPFLLIVAALNSVTRWRRAALGVAILLGAYCLYANIDMRSEAVRFYTEVNASAPSESGGLAPLGR